MALAESDSASDGERDNANKIIADILSKYNLSISDIDNANNPYFVGTVSRNSYLQGVRESIDIDKVLSRVTAYKSNESSEKTETQSASNNTAKTSTEVTVASKYEALYENAVARYNTYIAERRLGYAKRRGRGATDYEGYQAGYEAGQRITINPNLGSGGSMKAVGYK